MPVAYDWPGMGPTKKAQQAASEVTPAYRRTPNLGAKSTRVAFADAKYDNLFGGKNVERTVIGINIKELPVYQDIAAFLRRRDMTLKDWDNGKATVPAPGGTVREVRIQDELQRAVANEPAGGAGHIRAEVRLEDFKSRFKSTDRVVLTRNPYDLMTISTGRGPQNCMTIDPARLGDWSKTVPGSLSKGSLGVHITTKIDPTLARSGSNTVIHPYRAVPGTGETVLGGNYRFFGKSVAPDGVVQQISDHIDATFNANGQAPGRYQVDPDVYAERLLNVWVP